MSTIQLNLMTNTYTIRTHWNLHAKNKNLSSVFVNFVQCLKSYVNFVPESHGNCTKLIKSDCQKNLHSEKVKLCAPLMQNFALHVREFSANFANKIFSLDFLLCANFAQIPKFCCTAWKLSDAKSRISIGPDTISHLVHNWTFPPPLRICNRKYLIERFQKP